MIERWIKSKASSRNISTAAVVLIGVAAFYNWIISPQTDYLSAAQRYDSVMETLAKKNQAVNENMKRIKKDLSELQKQFEQFNSGLFDPNGAAKFLSDIQNIAEDTNCVVYSLNLPPIYQPSGNAVTPLRAVMSIGGSYRNIITLMNKLQQRQEQVLIDSISIKSIDNNAAQLKCDMAVTVYVVPGGQEKPND